MDLRKRILALDVGDVRIGVAASDELGLLAHPVTIIDRSKGKPVERVLEQAKAAETSVVVVGLPMNTDGTLGSQARKAKKFAERLRAASPELEIVFWDERFSTADAKAALLESGAGRKRRAQPMDALSAAVILQDYLEHFRSQGQAPAGREYEP